MADVGAHHQPRFAAPLQVRLLPDRTRMNCASEHGHPAVLGAPSNHRLRPDPDAPGELGLLVLAIQYLVSGNGLDGPVFGVRQRPFP
jgi:hypothetical protein